MSEKSLTKITNKYHCMVSGEQRMTPCDGCTNPKGCLSRNMQYKENDEMDEMSEKAVLKINADGGVVSCAKGLDSSECGYKAGAKVCGACGATAIMAKGGAMYANEEMLEDDEEAGAEMTEGEEKYMMPPKRRKQYAGATGDMPMKPMAMADSTDEEEDMEPEDDEEDMAMAQRMKMRRRRMASMGLKSADFDENAFVCAFERKVYPGASGVCENCPGGCAAEGSLPGLLEIEGIAEDMFSGKVLDSGYSDQADLYVVDIERKDGKAIEAFFEGSSAECIGWHLLDADILSQKSAEHNSDSIVTFAEAAEIATKSVEGHVIGVDPDVFEGYDAYAVEIEGFNGKSYDVYVSLDGEVLGYDEYSAEEAEEIEAEAAEIALKRAYSEESRMSMAESGMAMSDGSFPIKDEADLRNAIRAYGRAKDKEAAKAHIIKRAMKLGKEDLIPMNWVPKKVQEEYAGGKKDASDEFLANLMEFELLAAEEESRDILGNN